jgi:uncharacterized protein Yka (UPF0111/DUF47 family)
MVDVKRGWFLPQTPDLLGMLRTQAHITIEGMDALVAWTRGSGSGDALRQAEHRADDAKRALWRALRLAFTTPLDAEDLFTLSANLDEILNAAKDLVREMEVIELAPDTATQEMAVLLADGTRHLAEAFSNLGGPNDGDATDAADRAIKSQRQVERVYRQAMSALLAEHDLRVVMGWREVYRRLSRIGDVVLMVAERVWYAVVKEA